MEPDRVLYAISHIVAVICFIRARWWRQFPILFAYAIVDSIIALSYSPESRSWVTNVYMRVEPIAIVLRLACAVEVLYQTTKHRRESTHLLLVLLFFSAAAPISIWSMQHINPVQSFVRYRAYAQIYTGVFMLSGFVVLWFVGMLKKGVLLNHSIILLSLLVKQAIFSTLYLRTPWTKMGWYVADLIGLAIVSACWIAWAVIVLIYSRQTPPHVALRPAV